MSKVGFFPCRVPKIQLVIVVIASVAGIVLWWPTLSWSHTTDRSRRVRPCHSLYRGTRTEVSACACSPIVSRPLWSDTQLFNLAMSRFSHLQYLGVYRYGISWRHLSSQCGPDMSLKKFKLSQIKTSSLIQLLYVWQYPICCISTSVLSSLYALGVLFPIIW